VETVWETGNNEKKNKYAAVERRYGMALRKFKIKLEGKTYEAEVEEIIDGESQSFSDIKKEPFAQTVTGAAQPRTISTGSSKTVVAPMPGKIISIKCTVGQSVKGGDVLLILEAMKMEQEIKTKADGIISEIKVAAGMTVQKEDILIIIS
jgi:glutaconyl-CoA/methylmalonyl-CoA decarboxylase subunit gamma